MDEQLLHEAGAMGIDLISTTLRTSAQIEQIFDALSKAQAEMSGAPKDKRAQIKNEKANYTYAYSDLESVMEACRPALNKYGICVVQPVATNGNRITVTTLLGHKSGQWMAADLVMTSMAGTPQGLGSTITYGRRYGLQSMAGVASEDDDGKAGSDTQHAKRSWRGEPSAEDERKATEGQLSPADIEWGNLMQKAETGHTFGPACTSLKLKLKELDGDAESTTYKAVMRHEGITDNEAFKKADRATRRRILDALYQACQRAAMAQEAARQAKAEFDKLDKAGVRGPLNDRQQTSAEEEEQQERESINEYA
jgi:hypothetical protein